MKSISRKQNLSAAWKATGHSYFNILVLQNSYKVTARIAKFVPQYSSLCFHGCLHEVTMLHILYHVSWSFSLKKLLLVSYLQVKTRKSTVSKFSSCCKYLGWQKPYTVWQKPYTWRSARCTLIKKVLTVVFGV